MMVHTIGMLHKHTNNGMLAYRYMVCTDIDICNLYLYPCIIIIMYKVHVQMIRQHS